MTQFPDNPRAAGEERRTEPLAAGPDIALTPMIVMALGATALALSQLLRPAFGGPGPAPLANATIMVGCVLMAGFTATVSVILWTGRPHILSRLRRWIWSYILGASLVLAILIINAMLDSGLASVAFTSVVLVAAYVSLVLPWALAARSLIGLTGSMAAVQLVTPTASAIDVVSIVALVITGWAVGLLPRLGHRLAAGQALLMSRSDALTGVLNRRGFFEQVADELRAGAVRAEPVALLLIDLNGFKQINDRQGHGVGDELLAWVGARIPDLLPAGAALGRVDGDEFGVFLPDTSEADAHRHALAIHAALAERVGTSVGVGVAGDGAVSSGLLIRAADWALRSAKVEPTKRVQVREATRAPLPIERDAPPPVLTYAGLRSAGGPPATATAPVAFDGRWMFVGFFEVAAAGLLFVVSTWLVGGQSFWEEVIRYGGVPWIVLIVLLGVGYRTSVGDRGRPAPLVLTGSALLIGLGVGTAALSTGDGITSPIIAGLYLKLLFDASSAELRHSGKAAALVVACWLLVVILGPREALWAAPFQLVLLGGAFSLGLIGRSAFESVIHDRMRLAVTDSLTGLLNRRGFVSGAERAVTEAPARGLTPAVIALDLDDLTSINDASGYPAGDKVLQTVASIMLATLPRNATIGRLGGDEFAAVLPDSDPAGVAKAILELDERIAAVAPASIGGALYGRDGVDLEALMKTADERSYATKSARITADPRGSAMPEGR